MLTQSNRKIGLAKLILIILGAQSMFTNVMTAYYQMSYASVIWYLISAVTFIFPLVFMFAEYGSSIRNNNGGIYSWLVDSVGEKYAFTGTFIWLASFVINMILMVSKIGVIFSELIFGNDLTNKLHFGFLNSNEVLGLLGILLVIGATYADTKGIKNVAKASVCGALSLGIIAIFIGGSIILLFLDHGQLAQPMTGIRSLLISPNPQFKSPVAISSFIVYAMFAYGGIEAVSGLISKLKTPRKTFPKAMIYSAVIMVILYIFSIFMCGYSINWTSVLGGKQVDLANIMFISMGNLGAMICKGLGASVAVTKLVTAILVRLIALGYVFGTAGALLVFVYSPIKSLISGSSKDLLPKSITKFNRHDMPAHAMWIQAGLIVLVIILTSLGGKSGQQFFTILVDMNNIGSIFPYLFLAIAFIFFKRNRELPHNYVILKHKSTTYLAVGLVILSIVFAVLVNLITPILAHQYMTAFWSFIGPIFFYLIGYLFYKIGVRRRNRDEIKSN